MGLLDGDAKILNKNATGDTSADAKVTSNRKAGGQGLRRFANISQFNAKIKEKKTIQFTQETEAAESQSVSDAKLVSEPTINQPVTVSKDTEVIVPQEIIPPSEKKLPKVEHALESVIPQTEVVNTSKLVTVAETKVFETPQVQGSIKSVIPREVPQTKVLDSVKPASDLSKPLSPNHFKGNSLFLVKFIFDEMVKNGGNVTRKLTLSEISVLTGINYKTTDRILTEYLRNGEIILVESKKGNGGYRILSLNQNVFNFMIKFTSKQIPHQIPQNVPSKEGSYLNNNITNYTQSHNEVLQKKFNFKELDFTEVSPLHPMQVNSTIRKLAEEKLEKEEMQLFVDKFMVWVATQKGVASVIGLFCAKIKEFAEEGDSPVMQVLSKKELIADREFKLKAEALQKQNEMADKYREEVLNSDVDEKFSVWMNSLTNEEKISLVPEFNQLGKVGSAGHTASLRDYFKKNLYSTNNDNI